MRWRDRRPPKPTLKDVKEAALDVLLAVLDEHYDEWSFDGYWFTHHNSGVRIWTANHVLGLKVRLKDGREIGREEISMPYRKKLYDATKLENRKYFELVKSLRPALTPLQLEHRCDCDLGESCVACR